MYMLSVANYTLSLAMYRLPIAMCTLKVAMYKLSIGTHVASNDRLMIHERKEAVVAYSSFCSEICLEGLKKISQNGCAQSVTPAPASQ
jgi:hypothetical protein